MSTINYTGILSWLPGSTPLDAPYPDGTKRGSVESGGDGIGTVPDVLRVTDGTLTIDGIAVESGEVVLQVAQERAFRALIDDIADETVFSGSFVIPTAVKRGRPVKVDALASRRAAAQAAQAAAAAEAAAAKSAARAAKRAAKSAGSTPADSDA